LDSELVRQIVYEMNRKSSRTKITVKCRLGTNKLQGWDNLTDFVRACKAGGTTEMIIHARICILSGLSPAQNRSVPPLDYDMVHRLVREFPDMKFTLNGGIKSFAEADQHLGRAVAGDAAEEHASCEREAAPVHAVMIGREAYHNPWLLADADRHFYGKKNLCFSRFVILMLYRYLCIKEVFLT
jgi:tRNA-dihydrouridine synthase A